MLLPSAFFWARFTRMSEEKEQANLTKTDAALACRPSLLHMVTVWVIMLRDAVARDALPGHFQIGFGSDRITSVPYKPIYVFLRCNQWL